MQNLILLTQRGIPLQGSVGTAITVDEVGHRVFVVTEDSTLTGHDIQKGKVCRTVVGFSQSQELFSTSLLDSVSPSFVLAGLAFIPDLDIVFLASREGELISCDLRTGNVNILVYVSYKSGGGNWRNFFWRMCRFLESRLRSGSARYFGRNNCYHDPRL
jgi:hypothetical protein